MTRFLTIFTLFAFGVCAFAAPVPRDRLPPDEKAIKKRFYDCWHEAWTEQSFADKTVNVQSDPRALLGYKFDERGGFLWHRAGPLHHSYSCPTKLDTTRTPMWCDTIRTNNKKEPESVIPGIFKFEGAWLVLAYPAGGGLAWRPWSATGEYKDRPKDFERRPGVVIAYLERCEYLEQDAPPERVPPP